jgi:anti-sigma B factor antagonist
MTNGESRYLRTQTSYRLGVPLIYLSGELDLHSAGDLRELLRQELDAGVDGLLLECSELAYIDSGGLSVLFEAAQSFKEKGWLGIVGMKTNVHKLVEMTGLLDRPGVRVYPDIAAVKAALA